MLQLVKNYMRFKLTVEFEVNLQWVLVVKMTGTQWSEPTESICSLLVRRRVGNSKVKPSLGLVDSEIP